MAGNNGGSDRLIFGIGFDLDSAVKGAEKEWNNTYYDRLNKIVQKKPLVAKISFDTKHLDNLDDVRKRLQQLKLQPVTPETKSAIQSLVKELKSLEKILERIDKLNKSAAAASSGPDAVRAARIAEIESRAAGRAAIDRQKARDAAARAAQAEAKLEQAVRRTNKAYSATGGYIDRLIKRTAVLFGIHQVKRFAQKLRETTAEFELQRVSLGAIIQDTEKANALFNQIKTFAVQSPFEIKDLVGYVKQLSAYRIETDKLFDTTKRLADVSAGLGIDMGRLILAYGQVKAASVLRGQEVRQFTEAGIPLIQLLADKFTALRGEIVSTSEVFDLISQRAVSFEMVAEIFDDMTNAGGMFYNMQEKQAQTLAGQWSNLKDALSIMYDEMGNTKAVSWAMEYIISATKSIAKNWKDVEVVMYGVLGGLAIRGAMKSFASSRNAIKIQTENLAKVQKRYNQALQEEQIITQNGNQLEILRAQRKTEAAKAALDYATSANAAARATTLWGKSVQKLKAFFAANWIMLVVAAITAIATAIAHSIRKANELKNALAELESEGRKNITVMTRNFEFLANKAVQAADGSKAQKDALDELQRTYRDIIPAHKLTIENLREMAGNYSLLTEAIREYNQQQILSNKIETIIGNTTEKVSKAQTKLRKKLLKLDYIDDRTIERVFAGIEEYARKTSDSVSMVVRNAFKDFAGIDVSDEIFAKGKGKYFADIVNAYREQNREIEKVSDGQDKLLGLTKQYADAIKAAQKNVSDWEESNIATAGTFAFDTARAEKAAKEYLSVIKQIFSDSGLTFQDVWVNGKFIDFDAIERELRSAGDKLSSQAYNAFAAVRNAYEEIVPTEKFSKVLNGKLYEIAEGFGVNIDLMKRYMKDGETNINDYAKSIADSLTELQGNIKALKAVLDNPIPLNNSEIEKAEKSLAQYEDQLKVLEPFYDFILKFIVTNSGGKNKPTDDRLSKLKEEVSLLEKVYAKYKEYTKYISKTEAQERINREFGKTLEIFKKYKIELPKTSEEYQAALRKLQDVMRKLPKSEKDVLELGFKIEQINFDDTKRNLEDELKRLSDEVSRTKTAKEFFDKMLNMTGDRELSTTVTMSVYGGTGDDLAERVRDQFTQAFSGIGKTMQKEFGSGTVDLLARPMIDAAELVKKGWEDAGEGIATVFSSQYGIKDAKGNEVEILVTPILPDGTVLSPDELQDYVENVLSGAEDFLEADEKGILISVGVSEDGDAGERLHQLQEAFYDIKKLIAEGDYLGLEKYIDLLPAEVAKSARDMVNNARKANADWLLDTFKVYEEFKSFEQQRTAVMAREAEKRKKIAQSTDLTDEQKTELTQASFNRESKELNEIDWAEFKASDDWIMTFEDIDRVATPAIERLLVKLREFIDANQDLTPEQLRTIMNEYNKLYDQYIQRNPFAAIVSGMQEYKAATGELAAARRKYSKLLESGTASEKDLEDALKDVIKAQNKQKASLNKAAAGFNAAANAASNLQSILSQVVDLFGIAEDSELGSFLQELAKWLGIVATALTLVASIIAIIDAALAPIIAPLLAIIALVAALGALFSWLANAKVRKANKEIERQEKLIDSLQHAYERLQKASEQLFSSEYIANYNQQLQNLYAQIAAATEQLEWEKSKGSKKDKDKIEEYEKDIRDLYDEIEEKQHQLSEQFLGTDLASAARSFAQSWLDAYKEFGDTRKAIEEEMQKLMENLIVEGVLGAVMQRALKPVFDMIDNMSEGDFYSTDFWTQILGAMNKATDDATAGAGTLMEMLEQAGIHIRSLGSEMTGISKDIASASSEEILAATSVLNTALYYVSNIDRNVAQIVALMQGGGYELASGEQLSDLITIQNQHLAYLPNIALNTAQTAERCERAAQACESIAENLNRVIKPNGVPGTHRVVTAIQS